MCEGSRDDKLGRDGGGWVRRPAGEFRERRCDVRLATLNLPAVNRHNNRANVIRTAARAGDNPFLVCFTWYILAAAILENFALRLPRVLRLLSVVSVC